MSVALDSWIRSLQQTDGSLLSGYGPNGLMMAPVTEGMLDAYNAVTGFDLFHGTLLLYLEQNRYDSELGVFTAWPDNPPYEYALDTISWAFLALHDMPVDSLLVADQLFWMEDNGVYGYCFDEDLDTIWPEGSLEMAVAYITAGPDYFDEAQNIIDNMELLFIITEPNVKGLPYASSFGTGYGDGDMWEGVDTSPYLSSSAWYLLAKLGINPFEPGQTIKASTAPTDLFYKE